MMTGRIEFGGSTYFASCHPGELCGSNGLPLTPNSVTIYGRSQFLKTIAHPYLCLYLDIIRGKHERTIVVAQYHEENLDKFSSSGKLEGLSDVVRVAFQILQALAHINEYGIVHRNLSPENILFNKDGDVQLYNYGLYYMTGGGNDVSFPVGHPKYTAPEVYLTGRRLLSGTKVDVWSLGMIMAELALKKKFWVDLKLPQWVRKILSLLQCSGTVLERLAREHNCWDALMDLPVQLRDFLNSCLSVKPTERCIPSELLKHPLFNGLELAPRIPSNNCFPACDALNGDLNSAAFNMCKGNSGSDYLSGLRPQQLYYLWQLAGGDVESELKKQGLIRSKPPILSLPNIVLLEGNMFGQRRDRSSMFDLRVVPLPLDGLYHRLEHLPPSSFFPLLESKPSKSESKKEKHESSDVALLPLIIRERDTEYQFHRIVLFERLLMGYPYKKSYIVKEAWKDIPPFYRGHVWAALLQVEGDIEEQYASVDKETPTFTDRQIEVDIPRCHQYDELLSSHEGHRKFKRILKAWVVNHPQYVYWQGLDSLCAPFLYLNFNNEALAYSCLSSFIPKYLHNFFLKDNSAVIQEYLAKFSHLIAFHDPELTNHLDSIGFIPELYAIPWFLTMFSHVFPLHKIFHLWDKLLLGDASFPLFVGLAILHQLRDTLLASGFNECILLFSDLPEIDIERCVKDSIEFFCATPHSVTYRQHEKKMKALDKDSTEKFSENPELEMDAVPVAELQREKSPRISGAELLELLDLQHTRFSRPKVVVVDIRSSEDYNRGAVPTSINIPSATAFSSDGELNPSPAVNVLNNNRGKIVVVVGTRSPAAIHFAKSLVQLGYARVCVLHKGIEVLRSSGILIVPSSIAVLLTQQNTVPNWSVTFTVNLPPRKHIHRVEVSGLHFYTLKMRVTLTLESL